MFIKDEWVMDDMLSKRHVRQLKRRRESYPKWLVYGMIIVGGLTMNGAVMVDPHGATTPSRIVVAALGISVMCAGIYLGMAPNDRRSLRKRLHENGDLVGPGDPPYDMVMIEPMQKALVLSADVEREINQFIWHTQYYARKNNDALYFLRPSEAEYWAQITDPNGHYWLAVAGELAVCKPELFEHIKRLEQIWRKQLDKALEKRETEISLELEAIEAERAHHQQRIGR